ncbi:MAG: P-II family nitrogen regulator [Chloroflexota bacterium]|jgi:nitrogen regulatory protein PII
MNGCETAVDLIVTIVNRGRAESVMKAVKKAGADGGTILLGMGTGIHEQLKILGIPIHPEKEVVLTLVSKAKTERVLESINSKLELERPGHGLAFVLDVEQVMGVCHKLE